MYHLNASSFGSLLHGNIVACVLIIFMLQFTYVFRALLWNSYLSYLCYNSPIV